MKSQIQTILKIILLRAKTWIQTIERIIPHHLQDKIMLPRQELDPPITPPHPPYPPVGVVPGAVPVYAPHLVPYGVYPQPYPYPYPVAPPTVVVLPPGYSRDFSGGYSPWGNIMDDIDNIF